MTSPLKSASSVMAPEAFGDQDADYAEKYQNAKDAEDRLMELLSKRQESRLSPSMLSLAGALLDPGRTGSFGEAIGRGATAYAAAQPAEDKQLQENAMAQMQLRNMQLERAQQAKMSKIAMPFVQGLLKPPSQTAPEEAPAVNQTAPEAAPEAAPVTAQAPAAAPDVLQQTIDQNAVPQTSAVQPQTVGADAGVALPPAKPLEIPTSPNIMINGRIVNPEVIAGLKMVPATAQMGAALEGIYKDKLAQRDFALKTEENRRQNEAAIIKQAEEKRNQRIAQIKEAEELRNQAEEKRKQGEYERGNFKTTPWGYMDVTDPKKPKPVYIANPGEADMNVNFPEFNGETLLGSREDLMKLREARANKDAAGVQAIYNFLKFGVEGGGKLNPDNKGQPSIEEKSITKEGSTAAAKTSAEAAAKETQAFLANDTNQRDTVYTAQRIMKNVQENSQLYGLLKKPGIGNALASFIRDKGDSGNYSINKESLENFLRTKNFDTKDTDLAKVAELSSDLARLHFQFRKNLLTGQGTVSDREDAGVKQIQGTPSDSPEYLIKMAQLTGRRALFDTETTSDFRSYRRQTKQPYATLDQYKSDPTSGYNKLLNGYENWLIKTYKLPSRATPSSVQPAIKPSNANVAPLDSNNLDRILKERASRKAK